MKQIYNELAWDTLQPVMRPGKRVLMAVPTSIRKRYWRSQEEQIRASNKDQQGSWFLPGDDPQWDLLSPWSEMPLWWRTKSRIKGFLRL